MNRALNLRSTLIGMALASMVGCTTSGIEAIGKPGAAPEAAKHLVIHNEVLAGKITISEMNTRMTGGLLSVGLALTNLTGTDKNLQYRFTWYDADNFEVEQGSAPWTPVVLHGNASANLQAVAPNGTVTTYKVNVRELK